MAARPALEEHLDLSMAQRLSFAFGPRRGVTLDVVRRLMVGRSAHCDVHLIDDKVSREHCAFNPKATRSSFATSAAATARG